jgi:hypothetical protein
MQSTTLRVLLLNIETQHLVVFEISPQCTKLQRRELDMATVTMITAALGRTALLVVMESAFMASASPADVNIYNMLTMAIELHCQSSTGRDLKPMTLQGNSQYLGWGFTPSIWGRTVYSCSFRWGNKYQKFDVWSEKNQMYMCTVCGW